MKVTVIHSNRKTVEIQVKSDLSVVVRAPMHVSSEKLEQIIQKKESWIQKSLEKFQKKETEGYMEENTSFSPMEIQDLKKKAMKFIPERVAYFAVQMGVQYERVTIRSQKTRWGSCSSKGNLNFNCLLMLTPPDVIDYVIVHELCHRKEMNHSNAFWDEVAKVLPDYRQQVQWLKKEGSRIIQKQR